MTIPDSFWKDKNGRWTTASVLVREFCRAERFNKELKPEELYYILDHLNIKDRFASYWDQPEFHQRMGMAYLAVDKVNKFSDGWRAKQGDFAWAAGNEDLALSFYEESIKIHDPTINHHRAVTSLEMMNMDSCWSGYGGKFRLCFCRKQLEDCIKIFRKICPPHSFYLEYKLIFKRYLDDRDGIVFNKATDSLGEKYKETSPYFISNGKYMLQAVVFAATNTGHIEDKLREMICDYFDVSEEEVNELAMSLRNNEKEFSRLKNRIEPKPQKTDNTIENLIENGATSKAIKLCERLLNYEKIIVEIEKSITSFLQNGDETILDEIINFNPPFGISEADRIIFEVVLEFIWEHADRNTRQQLGLLRRFNRVCNYPLGGYSRKPRELWNGTTFINAYRDIMCNSDFEILPSDILLCLRNFENKQNMSVDGIFIDQNFEWCNAMLVNHACSLDRDVLPDEDKTNQTIYKVYKYLRERYEDAQNKQTWISEELLAEAIKSLFGKDNIIQHANPIWLSPQHIDIYLPSYNLAIEYMGKQHYEPVDYFGGEKAFIENQERDKRKAELCARMNVNLVYVTHDEDIGSRARDIFDQYGKRK
jgi:hypothetical protein